MASSDRSLSRRQFLEGVGYVAASGLAPGAFAQLIKSNKFWIAGTEVEFWITPIGQHTLRVSILASDSHLEPATAFSGKGLMDRVWPPAKAKVNSLTLHQ